MAAAKEAGRAMEGIIVFSPLGHSVRRDGSSGANAPEEETRSISGWPEFTPPPLIGPTNVCRVFNREFG
jgi:hypothetical protein